MYKRTIAYTDYNGTEREEDFYFALSVAEATRLEVNTAGGLESRITKITKAKNNAEILRTFEDLVALSYGEKSEDGRHFEKSEEITRRFQNSPAYDIFFVSLFQDSNLAAEFVRGIVPAKLAETMASIEQNEANGPQDHLPKRAQT